MNIFLIGYRGTGKTTIGRALAQRLGLAFVDTDDLIVKEADQTISQIFASRGESGFREIEAKIVKSVARGNQQIVSLGGGAVLQIESRLMIRQHGKVVWLRAKAETIARRLENDLSSVDGRPPLTALAPFHEIEKLLEIRTPIYSDLADFSVATDEYDVEAVVGQIEKWLSASPIARQQSIESSESQRVHDDH